MNIIDLMKYYDGKTVVDSVSFEIPKGKVLSLIGPNGAGKSTVMGMISRLIAKDSGVIDFETKDLSKWNSKELARKLAILTQHNNIQMKLTVRELVANNLSDSVGETEKATHGEEASWETIISLNPEYMFILDRSTATGTVDESVMGVREVIENDLIKELDVYKDDKIVYFVEHANVWYTSTGGVQALNTMLSDLEAALLH